MTHPQLRLAAATLALDLADTTDLTTAAHAALDDAIYADGLAVIATTPNMVLWEAKPHFTAALRELGHAFASQDDALRHLRLSYFAPVAEGSAPPIATIERYDQRFDWSLRWGQLPKLNAWTNPSAGDVEYHWDTRELWDYDQVALGVTDPAEADRVWEAEAVRLCRDWCREYARLYLQPAWRSPAVVSLAAAIQVDRAFDRLPILADALEEAGCDHPDLLGHCRHDTPHTDYCWLVDAVVNVR